MFSKLNLHFEAAHAANDRALVLQYLGDSDAAVIAFREAEDRFNLVGALNGRALAIQNAAWVEYESGNYRLAQQGYGRALTILEGTRDALTSLAVLNNSALIDSLYGDTDSAISRYKRAIDLQTSTNDPSSLAQSLHGVGIAYLRAGNTRKAIQYLLEALPIRRQANEGRGTMATLIALGNVYRETGDLARAVEFHQEALALKLSDIDGAKARYAVALDLEADGKTTESMSLLDSILESEIPRNLELRALALVAHGRIHGKHANYAQALHDLATAKSIFDTSNSLSYEGDALRERAVIQTMQGDRASALRTLKEAEALLWEQRLKTANPELRSAIIGSRFELVELMLDIEMSGAISAKKASNDSVERQSYLRALESRERWQARSLLDRMAVASEATTSSTVPEGEKLLDMAYQDLRATRYKIDRLRDRANPNETAIDRLTKEAAKLRREIDAMESHRLNNTQHSSATLTALEIDALRSDLDDDSAILVYSFGRQRGWGWLLTNKDIKAFPMPSRYSVQPLAKAHYECASKLGSAVESCIATSRALSAMLLPEAIGNMAFKQLLIAPDATTLSTPIASLPIPWESIPTIVGDKWTTSQISSLTVYSKHKVAKTARRSSKGLGVIVNSASDRQARDSDKSQAFVNGMDKIFGDNFVSLVPVGTVTELTATKRRWPEYSILHFGTHAHSDMDDVKLSALDIPAVGVSGKAETYKLSLNQLYQSSIPADLVVLAACDTAVGPQLPGEGNLSLAHGFLSAGANTVVASLWQVPDAATDALMKEFYTGIAKGEDAALALHNAQLVIRQSSRWTHPYYWSGFVVYD